MDQSFNQNISRFQKFFVIIFLSVLVMMTNGCSFQRGRILEKASFHLKCPEEQIELFEVKEDLYQAKGCDRESFLKEDCLSRGYSNCHITTTEIEP